ncbi:dicarboxylate/amino acid:cation symporter [Fusobacterium perfoetens]|uniref:dicarboxylate/amino acid:cation symporter n=1 Tax=Fusobacterium perfoetens TaxID=852 RepID=UPI000484440C|nr:dicarboxylate/amino acid:cation symporter [Fusobacterium perfoetens]MCI6153282.1 dicarboxylate/amino acid:cation symporter [Fusobacterium perfoetens]MDY3238383.1 dicarboxylate/amino acid:cation symporter [Fusobacterium perfoetens]
MSNTESKKSVWASYKFPILLISSIIIGSIIGIVMGERATVLKPFGEIFLNLMFTAIVPLVFSTIASAIGNMLDMKRLGKILSSLIGVFTITGIIAGVLIIVLVTLFPPAAGVNITLESAASIEKISLSSAIIKALTVNDFSGLLSRQNMLPLILFSILFGFCISVCGGKESPLGKVINNLAEVMMKIVNIIMLYAPIGLGAYFANLVGEFGPNLLGAYGHAMLIYYPACFLYFVIFFPIYAYWSAGKEGVRRMWKYILPPTATSIATQSSVATLPVNLEAAKNIGVPKDIREIVLPLGATMHMDGTVFSTLLKIAFLFGIFGKSFTGVGTFVSAMVIAVMSGVVMSGVPGGGLIGEMLIVSLYGFPAEAFPIIATIGFLVDPPGTCINATGDTIASMMVSKLVEGKDWIHKDLTSKE